MSQKPAAPIRTHNQFKEAFHSLNHTSLIIGRLRLLPGEEHILLDLQQRGVQLIPSATAQLASRSKIHQARIYTEYMLPNTLVVYDVNGLLEATSLYNQQQIGEVIVKQDKKNAGIGIHRFRNIEDVYNQAMFGTLSYPIVIQPFVSHFKDIRVVLLGDYLEAYQRINPSNFRNNLHCGGSAKEYSMSDRLVQFCRNIMERGDFPYAHIDLMITPDNSIYLTEINLRGGLRGARIDSGSYTKRVKEIEESLANAALGN